MQISVKGRQETWVFKIIFGKFEARLNINDPILTNDNKIPQTTFFLSFHKYYTRVISFILKMLPPLKQITMVPRVKLTTFFVLCL